ncbi:helix-turn-helix transcriptional regulator [Lachnospiraceae bacterium 45-W7]
MGEIRRLPWVTNAAQVYAFPFSLSAGQQLMIERRFTAMKMLCNEIFAQNLKHIRNACNLTQDQTVARLQVLGSPLSRSTYSLIELGRGNIYVSDLVALKEIFRVDYEEFFRDIPTVR